MVNKFPYDFWDMKKIKEHIMIVPIRHVDSVSHFYHSEQTKFLKLLSEYEASGHNFYGRSPGDITKSIAHQHTHLIKPIGKEIKFISYAKNHIFYSLDKIARLLSTFRLAL